MVTNRDAIKNWRNFQDMLAKFAPEYIKRELMANNLNAVRLMAALKPMSDWTVKLPGEIIFSQLAMAYQRDNLPLLGHSLKQSIRKLKWQALFKWLFEVELIDLHINLNGRLQNLRSIRDEVQWPLVLPNEYDYMRCYYRDRDRAILVDLPQFWHWAINANNENISTYPQETVNPAVLVAPLGAILSLAFGRGIRRGDKIIRQHGLKLISAFIMLASDIDLNTGELSIDRLYEITLSLGVETYKIERALMNSFTMREENRLILSMNQEKLVFDLPLVHTLLQWQNDVRENWQKDIRENQ